MVHHSIAYTIILQLFPPAPVGGKALPETFKKKKKKKTQSPDL
jgi:hypothetical protein